MARHFKAWLTVFAAIGTLTVLGLTACSSSETPAPLQTQPPASLATRSSAGSPVLAPPSGGRTILPELPAVRMQGEWRSITTADGLCTNWPLFIGGWFIGTGTTTICRMSDDWPTMNVPQGVRVTAANQFPPGGGLEVATDVGICRKASGNEEWECQTSAEGVPYTGIRALIPLGVKPVYMLADAVAYDAQTYRIPEIVGTEDAQPTWIDVSGEVFGAGFLTPEIWVGTNNYGIVVIQPSTGNIKRYTTADGLPGNAIRDVEVVPCPKFCDFRDVWVATDQGVGHWDGQLWAAYTANDGLPSNDIRGVALPQRNTAWVATARGAAYFDGHSWQAFTHANGLPDEDLHGVKVWDSQRVVFSTRGNGLVVFTAAPPSSGPRPTSPLAPEPVRVIQGTGDFPGLPVVGTAADGSTLALFWVEGSAATQLAIFDGTNKNDDNIVCRLSPDNQTVACLIDQLEVVSIRDAQRFTIAKGIGQLSQDKGSEVEMITSLAWVDSQRLLYSKVTWPGSDGQAPRPGEPVLIKGEIWLSNLNGKEQQLVAIAPIYRVLGISPNGQTLYVTYILPVAQEWHMQGFALLDMTSGKLEKIWPSEPSPTYYSFRLIILPDGSPRVLFVDGGQEPGGTVFTRPVNIWMLNPESRQAESIWTVTHSTPSPKGATAVYAFPESLVWSFQSNQQFIYRASGLEDSRLWRVDLAGNKEIPLGETTGDLRAWTPNGIIVAQSGSGILQLLDESGHLQGEINLGYIAPEWIP